MSSPYTMIGSDGREYSGSLEELREWAQEGRLGPATLVWSEADERWLVASVRHELVWDLARPEVEAESPSAPVFYRAGFVPRLVAFVADWMVILFLVNLVVMPWRESLQELLKQVQAQLELTGDAQPDLWLLLRFQLMFTALYIAVSLVYSVGFQGRFGATPGKRLLGLRVVTLEGVPLSYGGALRRYCAELLSVLSFGLGYLMVLAPEKRALHDILTGTQVVLTPRD
ncbi:MAG: RDD family protein [Verrucomicrobia bacterium]|jgi:uncharacterized RDD family membrane protein YckC|nr:RDD family protein [Verrucomicrobiota bacterium]